MSFMARYGNSCGTPFIVNEFCNKRRQWAYLKPYLKDRPNQPWTLFTTTNSKSFKKLKTRKHRDTETSTNTSRRNSN